jgi:hypothetical protein
LASVFVSMFQMVYDYDGYIPNELLCPLCYHKVAWSHRAFLPDSCIQAQKITDTTQLATNLCSDLNNCLNSHSANISVPIYWAFIQVSSINRSLCGCSCLLLHPDIPASWTGTALSYQLLHPEKFADTLQCDFQDACFHQQFNSTLNPNNYTLYDYCVNKVMPSPANITQAGVVSEKCKKAGFDWLNSQLIWGGTILIYCLVGTLKFAQIIGLFN